MRERAGLVGARLAVDSATVARAARAGWSCRWRSRAAPPVHRPLRTRILLADDHALVRAGAAASVLDGEPDLRVVAEAGDGASRRSSER